MSKSRKNNWGYIIFLILFLSLSPIFVFAQTGNVSLSLKNATLKQFFNAVEKQTDYIFSYRDVVVEGKENVTLEVSNQSITRVLDDVLHPRKLQYTVTGHSIIVTPLVKGGNRMVTGVVLDGNGEPIIGANVVEKGTTNGTVTDIDGKFTMNVGDGSLLLVSYIGFQSQNVMVDGQSDLTVRLREDTQNLEEVVVVGYGVQKKSNVTGSVASIKTDDFSDLNMDVSHVIQGRVAGVNVSNGNIIIRGAASINGADPLWIVDGVPGSAPNFNDIESIEILKDAASTAIYGARGAGGVILVTTKKGKVGKLSINARANFGIETPIDLPDMLHTADFIDRKLAAGFPNNPNSGWDNPSSLPDTNWEDLVWRNAFRQSYFLQMTGGNEKTTFNMSAEFYKNQFIERYSFEDAGNFRVASQTNISKRVKFSEILTVGFNNTDPHLYGQTNNDYVYYRQVPTMVPYDNTNEAGGGWGRHPAGGYYEGPNHLATLLSHHANERRFWARANAIVDWEIINDLKFQANFSANYDSHANNQFLESWNLGSLSQQDYYSKDYGSGYDLRMLYTLTYDHTTQGRSLSQFARVNYAYDDKYMLEASVRRDGYDNFGPNNRFGVFPSASAGWNIGKESFFQDNITWMSQLKLRGSYGRIGNNTIPQFLYEPSFTNNYLYYSYDGQNTERGFWYSNVANATIKWEDVAQWNIGLDASFLNNRLNTTIEYYEKKTSDMLYAVGVPPSAGPSSEPFSETSSYQANIGKINNKGFEWMVQWRDSYKDFHYDVAFTLSTNKNKVVKLSDQVNPIIWAGSDAALNSSIYRTENGQPMGQMYGYVVEGIFQDQAEIDALNAQSPDGLYQQAGTAPGDLKYKDLNGDGKVTNEDKTYIGNPWPDLIYGLNINLSWRGFDLSMGWLGNAGVDVFNSAKLYERSFYGDYNTTYKVYEAWSPTNTNTEHPRVTKEDPNGNFKNVSSYFVEDGSFFKLKNLHFGYNLPKSFLSRFGIEGLKFYVNCDNLFIITKFQGDPELGGGYLERNNYSVKRAPSTRTIMGGLSLTL